VDDGTNRRARYALTYRKGAGPETVFLKAADPGHAELNAATGGLFNESRMFRTDLTLPIEHPAVHLALIDEPGLDFLLVMEDIVGRGGILVTASFFLRRAESSLGHQPFVF